MNGQTKMGLTLTPLERIQAYHNKFPHYPQLYLAGQRIEGLWIMGNQYQTSGYYGAYPHGYLPRIEAMFQDAKQILHLFSGSLPPGNYVRLDIRPEVSPDVVGDAHLLSKIFKPNSFDLIIADPPYSVEDAEHYGKPMVKRQIVLKECIEVLQSGGWIIWLDQVFPNFSKGKLDLALTIGMIKSTNHRVRAVFGFRKK